MKLYTIFLRLLYTLLHSVAIPFILIRLMWKSRRHKAYRMRWNERFGYIDRIPETQKSIWVHAVSVGESIAAIPLVRAIKKQYPNHIIVMTTTTPTGSEQVRNKLSDEVIHYYAPIDIPFCVNRFLRRSRIEFAVIMETELWPNLLRCCKRRKIPVMLANGRLSERSKHNYQMIGSLTRSMLSDYTMVMSQGVLDGERLIELGLDPKRLVITGNIKFDIQVPEDLAARGKALRMAWQNTNRPTFIAASTHQGEEDMILSAFAQIREQIPNLLLVIVPRHRERFDAVKKLCADTNYQVVTRSSKTPPTESTDIIVGDTMGELMLLYSACDIAFVGGSLVPVGGHNPIEPASIGLPILTGPHLHNFTEIGKLLKDAGAAQIVSNPKAIASAVNALFSAKELREKMGHSAYQVIADNRGAVAKHLEWIDTLLPQDKKQTKRAENETCTQ